jgi:hypothetical protein
MARGRDQRLEKVQRSKRHRLVGHENLLRAHARASIFIFKVESCTKTFVWLFQFAGAIRCRLRDSCSRFDLFLENNWNSKWRELTIEIKDYLECSPTSEERRWARSCLTALGITEKSFASYESKHASWSNIKFLDVPVEGIQKGTFFQISIFLCLFVLVSEKIVILFWSFEILV